MNGMDFIDRWIDAKHTKGEGTSRPKTHPSSWPRPPRAPRPPACRRSRTGEGVFMYICMCVYARVCAPFQNPATPQSTQTHLELLGVEARLEAPLFACPCPRLLLGQPPLRLLRGGHAPDALSFDCDGGGGGVMVWVERACTPTTATQAREHAHAPVARTKASTTSSSAASASSRGAFRCLAMLSVGACVCEVEGQCLDVCMCMFVLCLCIMPLVSAVVRMMRRRPRRTTTSLVGRAG